MWDNNHVPNTNIEQFQHSIDNIGNHVNIFDQRLAALETALKNTEEPLKHIQNLVTTVKNLESDNLNLKLQTN